MLELQQQIQDTKQERKEALLRKENEIAATLKQVESDTRKELEEKMNLTLDIAKNAHELAAREAENLVSTIPVFAK